MSTRLSIAMIVKNEAQHLPECLALASTWADEICVTDTGSSDDTVAIAQRFHCRVSYYEWRDNFAEARNISLRECTGDWIFVLDADERIAEEDVAALRALVEGPRDVAHRLITRNYTNNSGQSGFVPCAADELHARGFAGWFPSGKVRLFPNGLGARFEGAVHELINPSLERAGLRIETASVPVHHYALTKDAASQQAKAELYLRLGRAKLAANPDSPKAYAELAQQYVDLGDFTNAAAHFRDAVKRAPRDAELWKDLGGTLHLMGRSEEAERALRLAVSIEPAHAEAWRNLGVVLAARGAWGDAVASLQHAVANAPDNLELQRYLGIAEERACE